MAPSKRKREEYESSDEEPLLGRQVLPVADLPDDFDGEPLDGAQYLFTVRYAASFTISLTKLMKEIDEILDYYLSRHGLLTRMNSKMKSQKSCPK
jgi:Survival motor neuron (SMN) interacting protein 1 (SIP1)